MTQQDKTVCPHCGQKMSRWAAPEEMNWGEENLWVCFNDECGYYQRGWDHTYKSVGIRASYRHRYDPNTGTCGPFPVNSPNAGKSCILPE
ncbi:MAG: ogr/Delta-like zinc finger family protein [Deltaproteobacteria bacterium]|nr:ogr/Delta-like zinc finger family protein [Deltaproteobacteria bacterium]